LRSVQPDLATFRRKIDFVDFDRWRDAKRSP
jgi:hypothetical protein